MKLRTLVLMASTALMPTLALAQAQAPTPAQGGQAQAQRPATQATSAAEFVNRPPSATCSRSSRASWRSRSRRMSVFASSLSAWSRTIPRRAIV